MTIQDIGNHALCEMLARILEDQKVLGYITPAQERSMLRLANDIARRISGTTVKEEP